MKTIILADNQDITKAGLLYLCTDILDCKQVVETEDKSELLKQLVSTPDAVVVLDYTLFDLKSVEEILILQDRFKAVRWILFSENLSEDFIRRVVFGGESFGIVLKDAPLEEIKLALQYALRSECYVCSRISNLLFNRKIKSDPIERQTLTATETEILKAIAQGKTTKEIALERFSSIHTITTHRKNIFRKLEVNNIHEATKYALRAGIIDSAEYYI